MIEWNNIVPKIIYIQNKKLRKKPFFKFYQKSIQFKHSCVLCSQFFCIKKNFFFPFLILSKKYNQPSLLFLKRQNYNTLRTGFFFKNKKPCKKKYAINSFYSFIFFDILYSFSLQKFDTFLRFFKKILKHQIVKLNKNPFFQFIMYFIFEIPASTVFFPKKKLN